MFTNEETDEIRRTVHTEMAAIERQVSRDAGSYEYLCLLGNPPAPTFAHYPAGPVLRYIPRPYDCGLGS